MTKPLPLPVFQMKSTDRSPTTVIFPDLNYGLVSFGNTGKTSNFAILKLLYHLIDEKLAIPPEKRYDWNKQ